MCSGRYVGNLDCPLHLSVNLKMLEKKEKRKKSFYIEASLCCWLSRTNCELEVNS